MGLFYVRFCRSFSSGLCTSFSYSFKSFSLLVFEPNISIQKESLSRVFKSDFLMFSTTTSILIFLSQTLELSIDISIL